MLSEKANPCEVGFFFSEMSLRSSLYSQYYIKLVVGPAKRLAGTK